MTKKRSAAAMLVAVIVAAVMIHIPAGGAADEQMRDYATFAGGCFWCMEPPFDELPGVLSTTSGYTGGKEKNPTYKQVSNRQTGHAEAIQIEYDPREISYPELLYVFWRNVDPTQVDGQFCDHGPQYRTAIYYHDAGQKAAALASLDDIVESGRFDDPIATEIVEASRFYDAEEYHQDFYKKNPDHYKQYRRGCGRDKRLEKIWGSTN